MSIRRGLTGDLRPAAWLSAIGLIAIALTARRVVVLLEVLVVLGAMWWLIRQIIRNTRALEHHRARLVESVADAKAAEARAEAEAQQKTRLAALLDAALASAPVGLAFFDPELRFLRVNATLAAINGRDPEDHIGVRLSDIDARVARQVEPLLEQVRATRQPVLNVAFRATLPGTSPEPRDLLTSYFPIVTPDNELFGIGAAVTDVTEVRHLEEQLLRAQKMEAVGRLAGGVAHDFNNLLTVISSYAELILGDPALTNARDELQEIRGAAARAAKLTRQLLAFSRRQAMEPRIVNPNDVLRGVETLLRRLIVGNIHLTISLSADTPLIRVDPGQLEQVVMNLAINAADAMPEGGELTIETASARLGAEHAWRDPDVTPGMYAMIRVRDTGHGIDPQTVTQIFEPFFTTKEAGRGTGLGLSTVYGIVKQSGGQIGVESTVGRGSVFTVYLAAVDGD